jgi:hypothetical protein
LNWSPASAGLLLRCVVFDVLATTRDYQEAHITYTGEMELIMTDEKNVEWTEAERKRLLLITLVACVSMVLVFVFWA